MEILKPDQLKEKFNDPWIAPYQKVLTMVDGDKVEIVDIARKIDTFDISIQPYEDCCTVFTPRHPKLRPRPEDVAEAQASFDFAPLVEQAISETEKKIFAQHVSEAQML